MMSATLLVIIAVAISAIAQICTDPRITRVFIYKSLLALGVYAVHVAVAIVVMVYLLPLGPHAALGVTLAFLGWIGFGMLGLIRFAPRTKEPPRWLMQFGVPDIVCLLLIVGGIASAFGLF
jgi:hypothetical protein